MNTPRRDRAPLLLYLSATLLIQWVGERMDARWKLRLVATAMAIAGIAGSIWHECLPWQWASHLLRDLSVALFVAGILAATVDAFFKTEFAKDVFNAAFSYFLPEELKEEIKRIIEYKFLCVKHYMTLRLTPVDGGLFKLEVSTERTIKNISRYDQIIKNSFALDEWGHPQQSTIEICQMVFGGKVYTGNQPRGDLGIDAIGRETEEISIGHGQEVLLVSKGHEIKVDNAEFLIAFSQPTVNPVVEVHLPSGFSHNFSFGIPGGGDTTKSSIAERYELNGPQFPGQYMRLRWWRP